MLQQTAQQKQELVNKVQLLDFVTEALRTVNIKKENKKEMEEITDRIVKISIHKLKLLDELIRLSSI